MPAAPSQRQVPGPARALAAATGEAVAAAAEQDAPVFAAATARLAGSAPEHVRVVLGGVLRSLLEAGHPDGLDGEDVAAVVGGCARAATWCPDVDPDVLVAVLAGALGVHEDEPRPLDPSAVARHASLLVAHLLPGSGAPLGDHLAAALAEVARAQTVEAP